MMELKIEFVAYFWDNPQGGSGRFLDLDMNVEVSSVQEDKDIWEFIHSVVNAFLRKKQPYNQGKDTNYIIKRVTLV